MIKQQVGNLKPCELFYIPEFNEGVVYQQASGLFPVSIETLKSAVSASKPLQAVFTPHMLQVIEKEQLQL